MQPTWYQWAVSVGGSGAAAGSISLIVTACFPGRAQSQRVRYAKLAAGFALSALSTVVVFSQGLGLLGKLLRLYVEASTTGLVPAYVVATIAYNISAVLSMPLYVKYVYKHPMARQCARRE